MSFFENTSKEFTRLYVDYGKLMTKNDEQRTRQVITMGILNISVNPDAAVLDVGCGGGANIVAWILSLC